MPTSYLSLLRPGRNVWHDGTGSLTYSFLTETPDYYPRSGSTHDLGSGQLRVGANVQMDADERSIVRLAVAEWNAVANVNIVPLGRNLGADETAGLDTGETEDAPTSMGAHDTMGIGDLAFGSADFGDRGLFGFVAGFPDGARPGQPSVHGDVWINTSNPAQALNQWGHTSGNTFIHEIGHALGLRHPDEDPNNFASRATNNNQYTVMSYIAHPSATGSEFRQAWPITAMMYDIQALQKLYGANTATRSGVTAYLGTGAALDGNAEAELAYQYGGDNMKLTGRDVILTIWDGGGQDVIDASAVNRGATIDLRNSHFSTIGAIADNVAIAAAVRERGVIVNLIEDAIGTRFEDRITGNGGDNRLMGGRGDDTIDGGEGDDTAIIRAALDSVTARVAGATVVVTSAEGTDRYTNVETFEFLDATLSRAELVPGINILVGTRRGDVIDGTTSNDRISGLGGNDLLRGDAGNDTLFGDAGNDWLVGGAGDDTLDGGAGADRFLGGTGRDTATYESATRSVRFDLEIDLFNAGDAVGDTFSSIEIIRAGSRADQLRGNEEDNEFYGGTASDRLYGRAGDDILNGEAGGDALYGNSGADTMTGGEGDQRDRFIYFNISDSGLDRGARDTITDFTSREDRIEISRFDADTTVAGNQTFDFVGDRAFSGQAGELRYVRFNGSTYVQADVNGDRVADFAIELRGTMDLVADDFLL